MTNSTFFPRPGTYAVVELDVEKTLQSYNDPVASAAAASIKTTKCIVYLSFILQLPFPEHKTFKYMVHLVGPGLRPEVPDLCLTPDMSLPIFPNTYHPSGTREPLKPNQPFPFKNCCHWFGPDMEMDLRVWNDDCDYPKDELVNLSGRQYADMELLRGEDVWRSICARRAREAPVEAQSKPQEPGLEDPPCDNGPAEPQRKDPSVRSLNDVGAHLDNKSTGELEAEGETTRPSSIWESESSRSFNPYIHEDANNSSDSLAGVDVFGFSLDERDELLPIVKIWLDIGAQFNEEDVPNPMEFIGQRNELISILKESKARARAREAAAAAERPRVAPVDEDASPRWPKVFLAKVASASGKVLCLR